MNQNTGKESDVVDRFLGAMRDQAEVRGNWEIEHWRANAEGGWDLIGAKRIKNVVLAVGLNFLASRAVANTASAMNYLAVGTVTAQPSLGSTEFGEVARKAGAVVASSGEVVVLSNTWGGAADSLTGIALGAAVIANHAGSGQGTYLNMSNSVNTTLQASDLLRLQAEIQIGSHNL